MMPVVHVHMWEGRTAAQKETLIQALATAFETIGVHPDHLTIIIHDVPKTNWGTRGHAATALP